MDQGSSGGHQWPRHGDDLPIVSTVMPHSSETQESRRESKLKRKRSDGEIDYIPASANEAPPATKRRSLQSQNKRSSSGTLDVDAQRTLVESRGIPKDAFDLAQRSHISKADLARLKIICPKASDIDAERALSESGGVLKDACSRLINMSSNNVERTPKKCTNGNQSQIHIHDVVDCKRASTRLQCNRCRESFTKHGFTFHRKACGRWKCKPCNAIFASKRKYDDHFKYNSSHSGASQAPPSELELDSDSFTSEHSDNGGRGSYRCRVCSKKFPRFNLRFLHEFEHTSIDPNSCPVCKKVYRKFSSVTSHFAIKHNKPAAEAKRAREHLITKALKALGVKD